jgi:molybdate transport system substrate-binding protein
VKIRPFLAAAITGIALSLAQSFAAEAAAVKVIAGIAIRDIMEELGPRFERATGHKLAAWYGHTGMIRQRIEADEPFDLALFGSASLDEYARQGKIAGGTRTAIARAGMGVGVRAGALKPDIGSLDAFKRALLDAKSITYVPEGAVGIHFMQVAQRLGIAEQIKAKAKPVSKGVVQAIADGRADVGFAFINELLSVTGVDYVGPFPPELQRYTVFTAGVATKAKEPGAARALIGFLTSPPAMAVIKAKGMEPSRR